MKRMILLATVLLVSTGAFAQRYEKRQTELIELASPISQAQADQLSARFDLLMTVNASGTFALVSGYDGDFLKLILTTKLIKDVRPTDSKMASVPTFNKIALNVEKSDDGHVGAPTEDGFGYIDQFGSSFYIPRENFPAIEIQGSQLLVAPSGVNSSAEPLRIQFEAEIKSARYVVVDSFGDTDGIFKGFCGGKDVLFEVKTKDDGVTYFDVSLLTGYGTRLTDAGGVYSSLIQNPLVGGKLKRLTKCSASAPGAGGLGG